MKQERLDFYLLEDEKLMPMTTFSQHIFDEVVINRNKSHIDQIKLWFYETKPHLVINMFNSDKTEVIKIW